MFVTSVCEPKYIMAGRDFVPGGGGGGGYSGYILVGVCPGKPKMGAPSYGNIVSLDPETEQPKKGGLRCGLGLKGGSLPRHIPILNIYVSTPTGSCVNREIMPNG